MGSKRYFYQDIGSALYWKRSATCQQGGNKFGLTKKGKGSRIMAVMDAQGMPIGVRLQTAGEEELPERVMADHAFDSDALDKSWLCSHCC
jgi:hypothetical protein